MAESTELRAEERAIVLEEEELLGRALSVLEEARKREAARGAASRREAPAEVLRDLRAQAMAASEDDLPDLLHELGVRQRLLERQASPLPDPASPYLAHLRVREDGVAKDYLLGSASLVESKAGVRIVDWRVAPVARLFYRYREGDEYEEEMPRKTAIGVVEARRVVVIDQGRIVRIGCAGASLVRAASGEFVREGALSLSDGGAGAALRPGVLGADAAGAPGRSVVRAKDVTAFLDRDQFAAIEAPAEDPLVVLGSAGSGKTTVALHRLARIVAREPGRYAKESVHVVVPERGLARLSQRLLEPLGVGREAVSALDDRSRALMRTEFDGPLPRVSPQTPGVVVSLKRSPAFYALLRERVRSAGSKKPRPSLKSLRRTLHELLTDRVFLEEVVARARGTVSRAAVEETVRHTLLQLAESTRKEVASIVDRERARAVDARALAEGTPAELAGTLDPEDFPVLLCMKAWRVGLGAPRVHHLVLDEAEDFSLFDLFVEGALLRRPASVTLAGDEAQQTSACFAGWPAALVELGAGDATTVRLATSYRCPAPVVGLAQAILGPLAPPEPPQAAHDGVPVGLFRFAEAAQALLHVADAVTELRVRDEHASVAVIAEDEATARDFFAVVRERIDARLVLDGEFVFEPGVDVTTLDSVKGLEFDHVVVLGANASAYPATDEARRRLHVAVTRAAHELWLVASGDPTPLVRFD